jgi:hypothetical protein
VLATAAETETTTRRLGGVALTWWVALLLGLALRAAPVAAARPYIAYVDEGHFLHPTFRMIRELGWDPHEFLYPQFPRIVVAAVARLEDAVRGASGRQRWQDRIPTRVEEYDELEPFQFLLTARILSVAVGIGIVINTGLLAGRLAGRVAGAAAALLAALLPALVLRGSIASVDSYAALLVIAALSATDAVETSRRPLLTAWAAGAFAGAAFASKYPAVLVFAAFVVTSLLLPVTASEKIRRLLSGGAGLVAGALAAMPALLRHSAEIPHVLAVHWDGYGRVVFAPSLWRQARVEAESTLYYDGPEVGIFFCLFAAAGLGVALRRKTLRPTAAGWCVMAIAFLLLFGSQGSRPFRNLLPLMPVGCVCAAIAFDAIRCRFRNPGWVDLSAFTAVAVLFALPMAVHAVNRLQLVDSRRAAVDWLAKNTRPSDVVVVARELAILDGELMRVAGEHVRVTWDEAAARTRGEKPRFVVAGVLMRADRSLDDAAAWPALADYRPVYQAGQKPTVPFAGWWHGNDQLVVIFERNPPK